MYISKYHQVNTDVIGEVFENFKGYKILEVLGSESESIKPLLIGKKIQKIERIGRSYEFTHSKFEIELESEYMTGWGFHLGTNKKSTSVYLKEDDWADEYNHTFLEIKTTKGSFKINASLFNDESEFWELIDSEPPKTEKQVQYALKTALKYHFNKYVELEVQCDTGRIDVLSSNSIWEVKHVKHWHSAIGQILRYSHNYPNHKLGICLFGKCETKMYTKAAEACKSRGITMISDFVLAALGVKFLPESYLSKLKHYDDYDNYNPYDDLDEDGSLPYDPEYEAMNPEYGYI